MNSWGNEFLNRRIHTEGKMIPNLGNQFILMITSFSGFKEINGKLGSTHRRLLCLQPSEDRILKSKGHPESAAIHSSQECLEFAVFTPRVIMARGSAKDRGHTLGDWSVFQSKATHTRVIVVQLKGLTGTFESQKP
ncbi:hypothetical protein STEG23_002332 [Scotinomys teguina]